MTQNSCVNFENCENDPKIRKSSAGAPNQWGKSCTYMCIWCLYSRFGVIVVVGTSCSSSSQYSPGSTFYFRRQDHNHWRFNRLTLKVALPIHTVFMLFQPVVFGPVNSHVFLSQPIFNVASFDRGCTTAVTINRCIWLDILSILLFSAFILFDVSFQTKADPCFSSSWQA